MSALLLIKLEDIASRWRHVGFPTVHPRVRHTYYSPAHHPRFKEGWKAAAPLPRGVGQASVEPGARRSRTERALAPKRCKRSELSCARASQVVYSTPTVRVSR